MSGARSPLGGLQAAAPARVHKGSCLLYVEEPSSRTCLCYSQVQLLENSPCCLPLQRPQTLHGSGKLHFHTVRAQQSVRVLDPETPPLEILSRIPHGSGEFHFHTAEPSSLRVLDPATAPRGILPFPHRQTQPEFWKAHTHTPGPHTC